MQNATDLHRVPRLAASRFIALGVEVGGDGSQWLARVAEFANPWGAVAIRGVGLFRADFGGDLDGFPNRRLPQVFASLPVAGASRSRVSSRELSPQPTPTWSVR